MEIFRVLYLYCLLLCFINTITSRDTITPGNLLRDGETLVSSSGFFELGFFSRGSSNARYLGAWYKKSPSTIFWVANRDKPLNNGRRNGVLQLNDRGVLLLLDATNNNTVWSSNYSSTRNRAYNPFAQLLDSGNLVVKNGYGSGNSRNLDQLLWQSFDHPCDTIMPGMKVGWDRETGLDRFVSSWKSLDDPGRGDYVIKIDRRGYPQSVQMNGSKVMVRAGSWNGFTFTGFPNHYQNPVMNAEFVLNEKEVYYKFDLMINSVFSRIIVTPSGTGQIFYWEIQTSSWRLVTTSPPEMCDNYAWCRANSICNISNIPVCECLRGYEPKNSDWNSGCTQRVSLDCEASDGFKKYTGIKLPDTSSSWYNKTMNLEECKRLCLQNCSCKAYSNLDIRGEGSGCLIWFEKLLDMRQFPTGGQDLYVRVPASEIDHFGNGGHGSISKKKLAGIMVGSVVTIFIIIFGLISFKRKTKLKMSETEVMDLPTFDLSVIAKATSNFSSINKLGEGGFGPVYKGTLEDGKEVAVKKLSTKSSQGLEELKNEVGLIAKLQHRNLVKLLGFCIEGEEKLLIYEYMPNKSLDHFIFDKSQSSLLDWLKRWHIIHGIARGLVYLHIDSRLRIIHRDLKTSNILLDAYMNPKISDFGLARTFWDDQVDANTKKVVGTYGYMSPEYAVHGKFSMKSDIFSFGVIVLEIVSGKKNRGFADPEYNLNLLGHAWRLWIQGRSMELLDECLNESCTESEVIRCIQVGLLCVQQRAEDRPDMSIAILMLNGEKLLPQPKVPAFYTGSDVPPNPTSLEQKCIQFSQNEISLTTSEGR
ncbi:hypothetical protein K1719_042421 [Acacia pycnantha]|nr:hypothetical protein K1719_042421 [Acacia pycnantha]